MVEDGYITAQEGEKAKKEPLKVTPRPTGAHIFAAEYFAEEVRRYLNDNYSEKKLYEGGLSVRTTLDPKLQVLARKALVDGLVNFDEQQGYRGADQQARHRRATGASSSPRSRRCPTSRRGGSRSCSRSSDQSARVGFQPAREPGGAVTKERETGTITLEGVKWAKPASGPLKGKAPAKVSQVLELGDVVYVEPLAGKDGQFRLRQVPEVSGAIVAMDPQTGRVLAMVGGFSYRPEPVQPRHPGAAPARLVVQAARLCRRARQRLHAVDRGDGRAARDRYRLRHLDAGKLFAASSTGPRRCASASSSRAT